MSLTKRKQQPVPEPEAVEPPEGVYVPKIDEKVRVAGIKGARFLFKGYGRDAGGVYAIVVGGPSGHRLERCVKPERIMKCR